MSRPRVVAVIQARTSSTRLPGKVLAPLAGAPALQRMLERVRRARRIDGCVVATSTEIGDDRVASLCESLGWRCFRGPLDDVLARFDAALEMGDEVVVRLTGDCPLVDPALVDRHVEGFFEHRAEIDYVTNAVVRTMPDGLDVEVFSRAALRAAHDAATSPHDREHVTPWIRREARRLDVVQGVDLSPLRWTLDTPRDYAMIAAVYDELFAADPAFGARDVYRLLVRRPELILVDGGTDDTDRDRWRRRIEQHLADSEAAEP